MISSGDILLLSVQLPQHRIELIEIAVLDVQCAAGTLVIDADNKTERAG